MSEKKEYTNNESPSEIPQNKQQTQLLSLIESVGVLETDFFDIYENINDVSEQKLLVNELYHWVVSNKVTRYYDSKYINYTVGKESVYRFGDFDKRVAENRLPLTMESLHDDKLSYRATVCWVERKKAEIDTFKLQLEHLLNYFATVQPVKQQTLLVQHEDYAFPEDLINTTFNSVVFDQSYRIMTNVDKQTLLDQFKRYLTPISQCLSPRHYHAWLYNTFAFEHNTTTPKPLNLSLTSKIGILKHHLHYLYCEFNTRYGTEKKAFAYSQILNFDDERKKFDFKAPDKFKIQFESLEKSIRKKNGFIYNYDS